MAAQRRRRGTALEQAILRAAVDTLMEGGYAALTMDGVARRAGTNKNAIYRRWPNRAALGVAAYRHLVLVDLKPPDTGSLRKDVLALLRRANCQMSSPQGQVLRSLLADAAQDPPLLELLREQAVEGGSRPWITVLERAVARGEARPEALRPRVAAVALVLLRNEVITRGMNGIPDSVIIEIADDVFLPLVQRRAEDGTKVRRGEARSPRAATSRRRRA